MSGIGDGQLLPIMVAAVVHGDLPREGEERRRQGVPVQLHPHALRRQQPPLAVELQGGVRQERQPLAVALAHQGEEEVPPGPQQHQGGPAGHLQVAPQPRLPVVHHRVADVVAEHGAAHVVQHLEEEQEEEQEQEREQEQEEKEEEEEEEEEEEGYRRRWR